MKKFSMPAMFLVILDTAAAVAIMVTTELFGLYTTVAGSVFLGCAVLLVTAINLLFLAQNEHKLLARDPSAITAVVAITISLFKVGCYYIAAFITSKILNAEFYYGIIPAAVIGLLLDIAALNYIASMKPKNPNIYSSLILTFVLLHATSIAVSLAINRTEITENMASICVKFFATIIPFIIATVIAHKFTNDKYAYLNEVAETPTKKSSTRNIRKSVTKKTSTKGTKTAKTTKAAPTPKARKQQKATTRKSSSRK